MKVDMDKSTIPEKPSKVTTAVGVLYLSFGIGLTRDLLDWWYGGSSAKPWEWTTLLILGPVFLWVYNMTGKGKNWARNFVLILTLATIPLSMPLMIETLNHDSLSVPVQFGLILLDVAGLFFSLAALIFLFQRDSADWFKAINQPFCAIPMIQNPEDDQNSHAVDTTDAEPTENIVSISIASQNVIATLRELTGISFLSLCNTDQPMLGYVWRAWLIAFIPSWVLAAIVETSLALLGHKGPHPAYSSLLEFLVSAVIVAPWLETLIMWPVLAVLMLILRKTVLVALMSGVIFGGLHVWGGPHIAQGVAATWAFLILSLCFLEWRKKSRRRAIAVTALVHTCTNGLVFVIVLVAVLLGAENPLVNKVSPSPPDLQQEAFIRAGTEMRLLGSSVSARHAKKSAELSDEKKRRTYERAFPGCRREVFELANDDLYPDWKKNHSPTGTWEEFLLVYKRFRAVVGEQGISC
jgi:hypothetical protein